MRITHTCASKTSSPECPLPPNPAQVSVSGSGIGQKRITECGPNLMIILGRFYLKKWPTHNFETNLKTIVRIKWMTHEDTDIHTSLGCWLILILPKAIVIIFAPAEIWVGVFRLFASFLFCQKFCLEVYWLFHPFQPVPRHHYTEPCYSVTIKQGPGDTFRVGVGYRTGPISEVTSGIILEPNPKHRT